MAATADELFDSLPATLGRIESTASARSHSRVTTATHASSRAAPRIPKLAQCAQLATAEVALMRMNDAWILKIGPRGTAAASVLNPERDADGYLASFALVAHVHPKQMRSQYEDVSPGPSEADFRALRLAQTLGARVVVHDLQRQRAGTVDCDLLPRWLHPTRYARHHQARCTTCPARILPDHATMKGAPPARTPMRRHLRFLLALALALPKVALAFVWRTLQYRTTVIAVTGSMGKTTAKDCLAAILAQVGPTVATRGNQNGRTGIPETLLSIRPWHRFAVVEVGAREPGNLWRSSLLVRPDVVLQLKVALVHSKELGGLEGVAREKALLNRFLRRGGTLVLNRDDERVTAMAVPARGPVVFFGQHPESTVRLNGARSVWPQRLSIDVATPSGSATLDTQLVGTHWAHAVLGAVATAHVLGATLEQARRGVAQVHPYTARLQPVVLTNGAVILRDEYNGSFASFEAALDVLGSAQVKRRILVHSDCADFRKKPRERSRYYGKMAAQHTDLAIFLGERCLEIAEQAQRFGLTEAQTRSFFSLEDAASYLRTELRDGDLLLLRGLASEHLSRLYYRLLGTVACQLPVCRIPYHCDPCPKLGFRPEAGALQLAQPPSGRPESV
jgi:UDP-N-acetylmuramoyl-tripeptide--D-alanyl-D-alanine ligase